MQIKSWHFTTNYTTSLYEADYGVLKKKISKASKVKIVKFVKKFSGIEYIFHTEYVRK